MSKHRRWYDRIRYFSEIINDIERLSVEDRDQLLMEIQKLIASYDSDLVDRHVNQFSFNERRRWYDRDPYAWLILNSLKFADDVLLMRVAKFIHQQLSKHMSIDSTQECKEALNEVFSLEVIP